MKRRNFVRAVAVICTAMLVACNIPDPIGESENTKEATLEADESAFTTMSQESTSSSEESSESTTASSSSEDSEESDASESMTSMASEETSIDGGATDLTETSNEASTSTSSEDATSTSSEVSSSTSTETSPSIVLPSYPNEPAESAKKDASYFADALFIGDSRVEGLMLYGSLYEADYLFEKGFNTGLYFSESFLLGGQEQTMAQYIESHSGTYKDIYVALGINETGWMLDAFIANYSKVVKHVSDNNPNTSVYVQAILPVAASLDNHQYFSNANIRRFNEAIWKMSEDLGVYFINPAPALVEANGAVPEGISYDGIHYDRAYVEKWQDYLQRHVAE